MKITLPITALAAVLGFALASIPATVHAQTPAATTAPAAATTPAAPKKAKYSGVLTAVDATSITITDKTVAPKTLAITPATKIKKDSKPATLADFKVTGGLFYCLHAGRIRPYRPSACLLS
jgi:hypothetical protein